MFPLRGVNARYEPSPPTTNDFARKRSTHLRRRARHSLGLVPKCQYSPRRCCLPGARSTPHCRWYFVRHNDHEMEYGAREFGEIMPLSIRNAESMTASQHYPIPWKARKRRRERARGTKDDVSVLHLLQRVPREVRGDNGALVAMTAKTKQLGRGVNTS
ncbi:hypothetical protein CPB85DRAFT_874469 [Mucidula mucida]|nr:hypothetical protein CPB85DRAFT_874469 [Mucidula mucida]